MRIRRLSALALSVLPALAFAQTTAPPLSEETIRCLRTELTEVGFTLEDVDDLFTGRVADPEAFVKGRIGEDGIHAIAQTCFPDVVKEPAPGTPAPAPISITPEQRACATQYLDEGLLDQILRGEVRPEEILSRERMEEIGRACFADEGPGPGVDLPTDAIACLKDAVGEGAFTDISAGRRQPTPDEYAKGEPCFIKYHPPDGGPGGVPDLPPAVQQCIIGIIGEEKLTRAMALARSGGRPESVLTPDETRKVGETCFGGASQPPPGGGPAPSTVQIPPEMRACLQDVFGAARLEEFLAGRAQPTPEDIAKAEPCLGQTASAPPGATPYPTPDPAQCAAQCTAYERPEGGRFTEQECAKLCAGEPIQVGPSPAPTGEPPPGGGVEQCVASCTGYGYPRDYCEPACRGEPVSPPPVTPSPTSEPPPPTPEPTPDTAQCVAGCTGYPKVDKDGTQTGTYSAEECQQLCGGSGQGLVPERSRVAGTSAEIPFDPWWLRALLRLIGY